MLSAEQNRLARQTQRLFRERVGALTKASLDAIEKAIAKGDAQTSRWMLEKVGLENFARQIFEQEVNPVLHPEDLTTIIDEMAERRVDEFLRQKGIGPMERLRLQPTLKAKELESLKDEYGMGNDDKESP